MTAAETEPHSFWTDHHRLVAAAALVTTLTITAIADRPIERFEIPSFRDVPSTVPAEISSSVPPNTEPTSTNTYISVPTNEDQKSPTEKDAIFFPTLLKVGEWLLIACIPLGVAGHIADRRAANRRSSRW